MLLTHKTPSPEQEQKILKRLRFVIGLKVQGWDDEDDIGFGECYTVQGNWVQWQIRRGKPCFGGFRHGDFEYEIDTPKINERLQELTDKLIKKYRREL